MAKPNPVAMQAEITDLRRKNNVLRGKIKGLAAKIDKLYPDSEVVGIAKDLREILREQE